MSTSDHDYCTVSEAAALLRLSKPTIRRWIDAGRLPAQRVGGHSIRIRRADLDALVQPQQRSPYPPELERYIVRTGDPSADQLALAKRLLEQHRKHIRTGSKPLSDSAAIIRAGREARTARLERAIRGNADSLS
jgi:excisionase family DNA binding protein